MKLTPRIKEQKTMMEAALNKLYLLEQMIPVIEKFDKTRAKIVGEELISEYADIMADLKNDLNTIFKSQPVAL